MLDIKSCLANHGKEGEVNVTGDIDNIYPGFFNFEPDQQGNDWSSRTDLTLPAAVIILAEMRHHDEITNHGSTFKTPVEVLTALCETYGVPMIYFKHPYRGGSVDDIIVRALPNLLSK